METINRIKNKTENFTIVSNEIFKRADVSARAKGIYIYIMTLPDDWKLYKSEIYKHFTEGITAIDTAFKELETLGYITKERCKGEGGKFSGWDYTIRESAEKTDPMENRKSVEPKSVNPQLLSTNSLPSTKETKDTMGEFETFWKAYPKKRAKGQAEKAWKKINPLLFTEILEAIENQKNSTDWIKEDGKYIPYPASWLNGKMWEDDVDITENNVSTLNNRITQDLQRWEM